MDRAMLGVLTNMETSTSMMVGDGITDLVRQETLVSTATLSPSLVPTHAPTDTTSYPRDGPEPQAVVTINSLLHHKANSILWSNLEECIGRSTEIKTRNLITGLN